MHRRAFVRLGLLAPALALLTPSFGFADPQPGEPLGVAWGLAFADVEADAPPAPMRLVSGQPPEGLAGRLYRIGPARFRRPGGSAGHWLDGDGLVRLFRIAHGEASLAARFVDTPKRRRDDAARAVVSAGYDTPARPPAPAGLDDKANAANAGLLMAGDALWALWDRGSPTLLDPETLATRGPATLRPDLAHAPFLSRTRTEPGGETWGLGADADGAIVWRLDSGGALISADRIDLPVAALVQDFTATQRHLVIVLAPLIQDHPAATFLDGFTWRPGEPTRILVIDKADLGERRLYHLPALFPLGLGPAWTEPDGTIRFDACVAADAEILLKGGREVIRGEWTSRPWPVLGLVSLSPGGDADLQRTETAAMLPTADPSVAGWPRAFTAHATGPGSGPLLHGLALRNWKTGASDSFDFGSSQVVEEAVFVARPGGRGEMDGWLLVPTLNLTARASELHVFDAGAVPAGPLCAWRADVALPLARRGVFAPG